MTRFIHPRAHAAVLAAVLAAVAGCGGDGLYPVRGTVVFADGAPYTGGGWVVLRPADDGAGHSADGEVRPDGTFELRTHAPGDGVAPGKYRAIVRPHTKGEAPQTAVEPKHTKFETSGLEVTVRPEPNADLTLTVGRYPNPKRR